jgi:hypothetical protein
MNSIAERFVKSPRSEALDFFLLISEKQLRGILTEYIEYYNALRPRGGEKFHPSFILHSISLSFGVLTVQGNHAVVRFEGVEEEREERTNLWVCCEVNDPRKKIPISNS